MQYTLFPMADITPEDVYDSPYGPIKIDKDSLMDLYRGAIGALRAGDNKAWSHPVKLTNGTLVELSAPLMLLIYDFVNEHLNAQLRN